MLAWIFLWVCVAFPAQSFASSLTASRVGIEYTGLSEGEFVNSGGVVYSSRKAVYGNLVAYDRCSRGGPLLERDIVHLTKLSLPVKISAVKGVGLTAMVGWDHGDFMRASYWNGNRASDFLGRYYGGRVSSAPIVGASLFSVMRFPARFDLIELDGADLLMAALGADVSGISFSIEAVNPNDPAWNTVLKKGSDRLSDCD